eukprot:Platyproteum_vivax@DN7357_c0_g1_i4.p1
MMKYFVLFASLLVVCFSKRLRVRDALIFPDIVFQLQVKIPVDAKSSKKQATETTEDVFKIRVANLPNAAIFEGLKEVVQDEEALQTYLDYLGQQPAGFMAGSLGSPLHQKWSARVENPNIYGKHETYVPFIGIVNVKTKS